MTSQSRTAALSPRKWLCCTSDERFHGGDGERVYLGPWCTDRWFDGVRTLPYPWAERSRFESEYDVVTSLEAHFTTKLVDLLNGVHGTAFDRRYWSIVLFPWLYYALGLTRSRYAAIEAAVRSGAFTAFACPQYDLSEWIPESYTEFTGLFANQTFDLILYAEAVRYLWPEAAVPTTVVLSKPAPPTSARRAKGWKGAVWSALELAARPARNNAAFVYDANLPWRGMPLSMRLRQLPNMNVPDAYPSVSADLPRRETIRTEEAHGFAEFFAERCLHFLLPKSLLESYGSLRHDAPRYMSRHVRHIFTSTAIQSNDRFKIAAAERVHAGAALTSIQHGGFYGTAKIAPIEVRERRNADQFITWGWTENDGRPTVPLPASKLIGRSVDVSTAADTITIFLMEGFFNAHGFGSAPASPADVFAYVSDQMTFLDHLSDALRSRTRMRPPPSSVDVKWEALLARERPGVGFHDRNLTFDQVAAATRIAVVTNPMTVYLEVLAANIPTILFWRPEHWEMRPSAEPYFEQLRAARILFDTPEPAATHLAEVANTVDDWWRSPSVQAIRAEFCHRFARTSPHPWADWARAIRALTARGAT